jgi:zinc carboxypeptidase
MRSREQAASAVGEGTMAKSMTASRKLFTQLRARVQDGAVRLRFYMSTPLFQSISKLKRNVVVRVYRRPEPGFEFGGDYAEYFDGAAPRAADKVFEGKLPAINERKFEFVDKDVKEGQVYTYWVSSNRKDAPIGPVAVKVRDPEVWWTADALLGRLTALANAHAGQVELKNYGRTVGGRRIPGVTVGKGKRTLALIGLIHAGESGPELIVPALERLVEENSGLLDKVRVAALPSVNADERERLTTGIPWYLRANANGVDLNRNFDADWEHVDKAYGLLSSDPDSGTYRGPSPVSEPETRAVVAFVRSAKPDAIFSYHHLASIAGCSCLAPKSAEDDEEFDRTSQPLLTAYTQGFLRDRRRRGTGWFGCTPGSLPAWAYKSGRIPCFDVEGSRQRPVELAACEDRVTPGMLREYQDRHCRGILAVLQALASGSPAP